MSIFVAPAIRTSAPRKQVARSATESLVGRSGFGRGDADKADSPPTPGQRL